MTANEPLTRGVWMLSGLSGRLRGSEKPSEYDQTKTERKEQSCGPKGHFAPQKRVVSKLGPSKKKKT